MEFEQCRICGTWGWTNTHRCPPKWAVLPDGYEEPTNIYAESMRDAVEKYAAHHDAIGDYDIANGNDLTVTVALRSDWDTLQETIDELDADELEEKAPQMLAAWKAKQSKFICTGALEPVYTAKLITQKEKP